ncbi:MAG: membrane protein insertase YidC [Alphaproteobacteria bacterium]
MENFGSTRNLVMAIVVSVAVIAAWQFFYEIPRNEERRQAELEAQQRAQSVEETAQPSGPTISPSEVEAAAAATTAAQSPRLPIVSDRIHGSLRLIGARFDDVTLRGYHVTVDPESPEVVLLSPEGTDLPYFVEFGWTGAPDGVELPGPLTPWEADGSELVAGEPLTLSWTNPQGVTFERVITLDQDYMFTVTQRVSNGSDVPLSLTPVARAERQGLPRLENYMVLHEGAVGVFDETLEEIDYSDLTDDGAYTDASTGGWIGFSDKYWLVALAPDQDAPFTGTMSHMPGTAATFDLTWAETEPTAIAPGESQAVTSHFYAGAKDVRLLDDYGDALRIPLFDRAVDFGWFYFLTKPLFLLLTFIHGLVGNFGVAIMILTVIVRLFLFPLANKSYKSMSRMKKLGPQMQALRERYKEDKPKLQQEMMAMYKREKVNPAAGCLPLLLQIPVFFALYKVFLVSIEMRHAPFVLWIKDLTAHDPTTIFNLFGLIPWEPPTFLMVGVLPLMMGAAMWAQQQLNPAPPDPVQAKIFGFLPIVFTFFLASFPAGLVLYWTCNNILSLLQQYVIMRRMGAPIGRKAGAAEQARLKAEADRAIEEARREAEERKEREKAERAAARAAAPAPSKPFKPKKARAAQRGTGAKPRPARPDGGSPKGAGETSA